MAHCENPDPTYPPPKTPPAPPPPPRNQTTTRGDPPPAPPPPERWHRYVDAMERGRLTADQVRAMEDLPPLPPAVVVLEEGMKWEPDPPPKTPVDWSGVNVGVQTEDYDVQAGWGCDEHVCRRYIVTGIPREQGSNEGAMVLAVRAPGVPRIGDPHPMREDLLVSDIRASADAKHGPYMAHVEVTYTRKPYIPPYIPYANDPFGWINAPFDRIGQAMDGTQAWKLILATAAVWALALFTVGYGAGVM